MMNQRPPVSEQDIVYLPVSGIVEEIRPMDGYGQTSECSQMITLRIGEEPDTSSLEQENETEEVGAEQIARMDPNIVNVIIGPQTCFVNGIRLYEGMRITAFYDGNAPMPLIYPPQYQALVVAEQVPGQNIYVGTFNGSMTAADHRLRLNLDESVDIVTQNGQNFYGSLAGKSLVVIYGPTTRSIPPQTTPYQIVVLC